MCLSNINKYINLLLIRGHENNIPSDNEGPIYGPETTK